MRRTWKLSPRRRPHGSSSSSSFYTFLEGFFSETATDRRFFYPLPTHTMRIKNSPLTESFLVVPLPEIKNLSPLLKFRRRTCVAGKHAAKRSGTSTTGRDPSLLITTIWKSCPCSVSVDGVAYIKLFLLLFLFLDLEKWHIFYFKNAQLFFNMITCEGTLPTYTFSQRM